MRIALVLALFLAGCGWRPDPPEPPPIAQGRPLALRANDPPALMHTLTLPAGGQVFIVEVQEDEFRRHRCAIQVTGEQQLPMVCFGTAPAAE